MRGIESGYINCDFRKQSIYYYYCYVTGVSNLLGIKKIQLQAFIENKIIEKHKFDVWHFDAHKGKNSGSPILWDMKYAVPSVGLIGVLLFGKLMAMEKWRKIFQKYSWK